MGVAERQHHFPRRSSSALAKHAEALTDLASNGLDRPWFRSSQVGASGNPAGVHAVAITVSPVEVHILEVNRTFLNSGRANTTSARPTPVTNAVNHERAIVSHCKNCASIMLRMSSRGVDHGSPRRSMMETPPWVANNNISVANFIEQGRVGKLSK
jgi:hypothetical protein